MKLNQEPLKNWFGFTRRERSSTFILLLIIILIISIRYTIPERTIDIEELSGSISGTAKTVGTPVGENSAESLLFYFDPNTASYDTLIRIGLNAKEANTLINYRNKGGKFRNPSDIKKVYGIEEEQAERLIPFVAVKTGTKENVRINFSGQQKILIEINSCDSASLVRLPGIGPVLSARIIKYRHLLGGFVSTNQLREVYGLSPETFDLIKGRVYADSSAVIGININTIDYKGLVRLPYFEKYEVTAILKYRELKGRITGIDDLIENKLITDEKAIKVRSYLKFE